MANKIQLRRGIKSKLPTLVQGEPAYTTDTHELFIGTGNGNVNMGGGKWYNGTALSGTNGTYSYDACPLVKAGDMYLNTSNGNVYECTTAGNGSNAKWTYKGCIKGTNGTTGPAGPTGPQGPAGPTGSTGSRGPAGTNGTNGKDGKDGKDAAEYVVSNQSEFAAALEAIKTTGGKIILRGEGTFSFQYSNYGLTSSQSLVFVFEGMGAKTKLEFRYSQSEFSKQSPYFMFKDMSILLANPQTDEHAATNKLPSYMFENCNITGNGHDELLMNFNDCVIIGGSVNLCNDSANEKNECYSGFYWGGTVRFFGCNITLDSGSLTYNEGYDVNLTYNIIYFTSFNGCRIRCNGNQRTNIVNNALNLISNCCIELLNDKATICHTDTGGAPRGTFTGNYVRYYATRLSFGTVNGNRFEHAVAGSSSSNQIVLQCPTNMTGNIFTGQAVYINGQSKKHIIDRNLYDNGLTVTSTASGTVNSNNVQY